MQVYLLGAFQAIRTGEGDVSFRSDSERALLAFLAVESDRPHRRESLGALLWPEAPPDQARNNLRVTLHRLKQALEAGETPSDFLVATRTEIQIRPVEPLRVDFLELAGMIDRTARHAHADLHTCAGCAADLATAVRLYRGEFLQGFALDDSEPFEAWVRAKREWAHRAILNALFDLAEHALASGEPGEAESYARRQLALELWREKAHRQLMTALALRGERPAALAQYGSYVEILQEELGAGPSPEMEAHYERIRAGGLEGPAGTHVPAPEPAPGPAEAQPDPAEPAPPESYIVPDDTVPDSPRGRNPRMLAWFFLAGVLLIVWIFNDRIGPTNALYDGFNNPAFDGTLDIERWFFPHELPGENCAFKQASGELVLSADPETEDRICILRVASPRTVPGHGLGDMEVKMRADDWDPEGSIGVALRVSASLDEGDWNVDCGLLVDPAGLSMVYSVSDTRLPESQAVLASAARPVEAGAWYPVRLEVDPETMEVVCLVDGAELGRYRPDDPELLLAAEFVRELLPWVTPEGEGRIRLDDFRIDAPAQASGSP